jgi:hypothetical protein
MKEIKYLVVQFDARYDYNTCHSKVLTKTVVLFGTLYAGTNIGYRST